MRRDSCVRSEDEESADVDDLLVILCRGAGVPLKVSAHSGSETSNSCPVVEAQNPAGAMGLIAPSLR